MLSVFVIATKNIYFLTCFLECWISWFFYEIDFAGIKFHQKGNQKGKKKNYSAKKKKKNKKEKKKKEQKDKERKKNRKTKKEKRTERQWKKERRLKKWFLEKKYCSRNVAKSIIAKFIFSKYVNYPCFQVVRFCYRVLSGKVCR